MAHVVERSESPRHHLGRPNARLQETMIPVFPSSIGKRCKQQRDTRLCIHTHYDNKPHARAVIDNCLAPSIFSMRTKHGQTRKQIVHPCRATHASRVVIVAGLQEASGVVATEMAGFTIDVSSEIMPGCFSG